MKNLNDYVFAFLKEAKESGKPIVKTGEEVVTVDGKHVKKLPNGEVNIGQYAGVPAKNNGSHGLWGLEEPTEEDAVTPFDEEEMNDNEDKLAWCLDAGMPFFIQGRAGWAKTALIKRVAKHYKYSILTVYLDKAEATDLNGIPVAREDKDGDMVQDIAWPAWAKIIRDNPEKKFLLFFDEMNQARPDVQNALMPIVNPDQHQICGHKLDNYLVAAAGNLEEENIGVTDLQGPLMSRFYYIQWESNTPNTWKSAFKYLHSKWDGVLGEDCISDFEKVSMNFNNPREVEQFVFTPLSKVKNGEFKNRYNTEFFYKNCLKPLVRKDPEGKISRIIDDDIKKLANKCANYVKNGIWGDKETIRSRKDRASVPLDENDERAIKNAARVGYLSLQFGENDSKHYIGISKESLKRVLTSEKLMDDTAMNAEQAERYIKMLETNGIKFKYNTDKDFPKDKYESVDKYALKNNITFKDLVAAIVNEPTKPKKHDND